jgi:hypothetical protein
VKIIHILNFLCAVYLVQVVINSKIGFDFLFFFFKYNERVSEIGTLILTSGRFRQEQQNCFVPFFLNIIFI